MNKATIVTDLNYGDSGKGSIVDYLCSKGDVDLVVRFNGGCQAAHNVIVDGFHHTFSQFGSGTLRGVPTYLDSHVIVDPQAMMVEADHLKEKVHNPLSLLAVDPECLITTIYHKTLNHHRNAVSGHGSTGMGIGVTREMWSKTGNGLKWKDLASYDKACRKMHWVRQWCQDIDYSHLVRDVNLDYNNEPISFYDEVDSLCEAYSRVTFHRAKSPKHIVFEGSQGFELDEVYGTIPHTTYSNTRPTYAVETCYKFGVKPHIIGVTRTYETRHGNGPMSYEGDFAFPDHNSDDSYAGKFRFGHMDFRRLARAASICEADSLAVNHIDHLPLSGDFEKIAPVSIYGYGPSAKDKYENPPS